ncbi:MAG: ABC transporter permease subunit [Nocardioides sp.]
MIAQQTITSATWAYLTDAANWAGPDGIWSLLGQQLLITVTALAIALVIGLPLALWLGHIGRGGTVVLNSAGVGRAVPTFALLALLVSADWPGRAEAGPFGRAGVATLLALAAFALPPLMTQAYVAIREVAPDIKEAATGMGMSAAQRFWSVELPLAAPLVWSGIRLALVQVWATATIAAMVAGPGLGRIITDGFFRSNYGKGVAGAVIVAAVALLLELGSVVVARMVTAPPMRHAGPFPRTQEAAR